MKAVIRYKRRQGGKVLADDQAVSIGWGVGDNFVDEVRLCILGDETVLVTMTIEEAERVANRILESVARNRKHRSEYVQPQF